MQVRRDETLPPLTGGPHRGVCRREDWHDARSDVRDRRRLYNLGCEPFCGDKSDAPPPTPKPTTALPKGGKADEDEDESDGAAALSLSLATAVAALFAV